VFTNCERRILNVTTWWAQQLFYHVNTGGFIHLTLES
jgi:hypothetical protein